MTTKPFFLKKKISKISSIYNKAPSQFIGLIFKTANSRHSLVLVFRYYSMGQKGNSNKHSLSTFLNARAHACVYVCLCVCVCVLFSILFTTP